MSPLKILILNGPNLNLLGIREPETYGTQTFEVFFEKLKMVYPAERGIVLEYFQSNIEGILINKLHETGFSYHGIIFNPGAYTHTSIALADAVAAIQTPVLEVHISNTAQREAFRQHSYIAKVAAGSIVGLGLYGYRLAVEYFIDTPRK